MNHRCYSRTGELMAWFGKDQGRSFEVVPEVNGEEGRHPCHPLEEAMCTIFPCKIQIFDIRNRLRGKFVRAVGGDLFLFHLTRWEMINFPRMEEFSSQLPVFRSIRGIMQRSIKPISFFIFLINEEGQALTEFSAIIIVKTPILLGASGGEFKYCYLIG